MPRSTATAVDVSQELVRFLLAMLDAEEAELKQRAPDPVVDAPWGAARVRTELETKRRLIGALQQLVVLRDQPAERAVRHQATQMLRVLALPYDWHANYRDQWRPAGSH
jgi:hypothetical protein